ncbi:MAG: thiamine-phosphate kinase [bacterium]|nr:thiamine-phosphate kinase [bacterium]
MSGGDEFTIIRGLMAPLAHHPGARRLADDGAVLSAPSGMDLAVTKDMMVEGVHFLPDDPADLVARKLLRANLSDLAAMGAEPCGYLLGLASDGRRQRPWLEDFAHGLARDQEEYGISLLGGDTVASEGGLLTLSITAFGEVPGGMSFARDMAREGDVVAVTGTIGDAALGLLVRTGALHGLGNAVETRLVSRYRLPQPRVSSGVALRRVVHGAIDISDGLLADAAHLATASRLAIELAVEAIPLSEDVRCAIRRDPALRDRTLTGGDDYELLVTLSPDDVACALAIAGQSGVPLTVIGRCHRGSGLTLLDGQGEPLEITDTGWRHSVLADGC